MSTTTAEKTIEVLHGLFARFGLLQHVVSDNGPQFVLAEFAEFMWEWYQTYQIPDVLPIPSSNGAIEHFNQTLKAGRDDGRSLQQWF